LVLVFGFGVGRGEVIKERERGWKVKQVSWIQGRTLVATEESTPRQSNSYCEGPKEVLVVGPTFLR